MEQQIKILLMYVSWKGHQNLWSDLFNRGVNNMIILCGGSEETHLEDKILYLKCNDSYEGLPEKMICAIDFVLNDSRFSSYTHILKIDDHDSYCSQKTIDFLVSKCSNILKSNDYIGQNILDQAVPEYHFNRVEKGSYWYKKPYKGESVPFAIGGSTYILSRNAMSCINNTFNIKNLNFVRCNFIHEDVMIGLILFAYDIKPHWLNYGVRTFINPVNINGVYGQWKCIGIENQKYGLPIGSHVRFGRAGKWVQKLTDVDVFTGNVEYFQEDPCEKILKNIELFIPF